MPEPFRYMLACWKVMIAGELIHQVLSVISLVIDPSALRQAATEAARSSGEQASDAVLTASVFASVAVMALFQLAVVAVLAISRGAIADRKKWARNALRLLQVFSVYFALRAAVLFLSAPASTRVPVAMYAVDGALQIALAAAGVCAVLYSLQDEVQRHLNNGEAAKER
ncbi:hypothetical protein CAPI_01030 [Corynebacterium capitovis DSM 44611]|uniref:hypothetical protein n=1 Tax=Corynebacterium capitovis TaxID=131081 RepID=UPI00036266E6|nr:hypothetical protein [Corynebacterium capitovis]WKD56784.1 hypothetical protein CAPI_01030 [Corynebacterium capitovis DSM 44611]